MCVKIKSKQVKGVTFDVELVKVCSSVLVSNIDPKKCNEEIISLYFESEKKSGGSTVKEVSLNNSGGAVVTFEDPSGMLRIDVSLYQL